MEKNIYFLAEELHTLLVNDERIVSLNLVEKAMNENEEVMRLTYIKDLAVDNYNSMINLFKEDSEEVKTAQKKLYEAKKDLESHPLVREYLSKYQKVRLLLEDVNNILFENINEKRCCK